VTLRALDDLLAGDVVLPGAEGWNAARLPWNLAVEQRPVAVVYPESADDFVTIVRFAREHGLRVAFNGGGHNAGPIGWDDHALLVKTERLRGPEIDPVARRARVPAGTLSDELAYAAGEHGLAYLAGTSPDVGVVGYVLGGGLSWLVRKYGLASNTVTAVELVTADGELVRATPDDEPDLFWAVRGGGGNFGAVTALELELFPHAEIYAGVLFWPLERAVEILAAWRDWVDTVPEECSSLGRLLRIPDLPFVPEHLRLRDFVMVEPAFLGSDADGAALLEPLRALEPEFDTVATIPTGALGTVNMDPPGPMPYRGEGIHLHGFDRSCIETLVEVFVDAPLTHCEVRHLGGAAARSLPGHGALDRIEAPFTTLTFGLAPDAATRAEVARQLLRLHAELAPWDSGMRYLNFAESAMDVATIYPRASYERLCALKARYDPTHLFLANHPLRAAP
jgi:FAD/FMN-containing dehydrogenase